MLTAQQIFVTWSNLQERAGLGMWHVEEKKKIMKISGGKTWK